MTNPARDIDPLAAVQGGIARADFERRLSASVPPPQPAAPPETPPAPLPPRRLPPHRRFGRAVLRALRPLAAPILTRFQGHIALGLARLDIGALLERRFDAFSAQIQERISADLGDLGLRERFAGLDRQAQTLARRQSERLESLAAATAAATEALSHKLDALAQQQHLAAQAGNQTLAGVEHLLRCRNVPLGSEVLSRTSHGWLLLPAEDLRLVAAMAEAGDALEPGSVAALRAVLSPGDLAVDVGANVGAMTLAMAAAVGDRGRVVAFEPTPRLADLLRRSLAVNGVQDFAEARPVAVGEAARTARLHLGITSAHNSLLALEESHEAIEVPVRPLDDLLAEGPAPALVKIDVEGAELEVLRGMRATLARAPNLAILVEFGPSHLARAELTVEGWLGAFRAEGFTPWLIDEAARAIRPLPGEGLEAIFSVNLLMLRHPPARWPRLVVGPAA